MRIWEGKGMITLSTRCGDALNANEIISVEHRQSIQCDADEYQIIFGDGRRMNVLGYNLTDEQVRQIAKLRDKQRFMPEPVFVKEKKPKRLRCEYCGRIALTERSTCEGCGAVLPWEMSYEE